MKISYPLIFAFTLLMISEAAAQDKIYVALAEQTCECIKKKDIDKMNTEELTMELGLCMIEGLTEVEGADQLDLDFSNNQAMEVFGAKVGTQMATICPEPLMKIGLTEMESKATLVIENFTISGVIEGISGTDFNILTIKEENGRTHKLLWFGYFTGSEKLLADPKKGVGKKVSIGFQKVECYSPKISDYYDCKEIKELTFLE